MYLALDFSETDSEFGDEDDLYLPRFSPFETIDSI